MTNIKYKKYGNTSKYIILMHDWMVDSSNYDSIIPYINIDDYTWIFIDFRGYGKSKDIKGRYDLDEACDDIKDLILEYKMKELSLVGHSMSSLIAQKIAIDIQDILNTLILITPIPPTGIKMKEGAKQNLLENVKNENGVIEQVVQSASKRYNHIWQNQRIKQTKESALLEARLSYMNMYLSNDFSNEIIASTKTRVITGRYDLPAFHKNSVEKSLKKYYENLEIIECQEAGHYPMIECPVFFANQVEKFIEN